jgi:hypothetical protein
MKILILIIGLGLSSVSFAKTKNFEVQVDEVSVNGSLDVQPRKLNVKPNQPVVISRSFDSSGVNTVVEMKVSDDDSKIKDGILISLSITEEKDGTKKIVGTPQMIVKSGHKAKMTEGKEGETPFFKASLTGTRVQ